MAVWLDRMLAPLLRRYSMQTARRFFAKPQQGRINLGWSRYMAELEAAESPSARRRLLGHSPGMASSIAGVSRQAIHDAIDRGNLTAFYIHDDDTGELRAILIPDESLQAYIAHPTYQRRRFAR